MGHKFLISLMSSAMMLILKPLIIDVILVSEKICCFFSTIRRILAYDDTVVVDDRVILDDNPNPSSVQRSKGWTCHCHDVGLVTSRLGLARWRCRGKAEGCDMMEVVDELLESKRASEDELEEAFCVFDRNVDGFICAVELWSVMRRLGLKEGVRYEDCMRMILAFDEDGDGRINFLEFRRMMENAI